jgi:hypothetical protein
VPSAPKYEGQRFESLEAALAHGPKRFAELMAATGTRDGRDVVRQLEDIAATRAIMRDEEGRYSFA